MVERCRFVPLEFKCVSERWTLIKSWNEGRAVRREGRDFIEQRSAHHGPLPVLCKSHWYTDTPARLHAVDAAFPRQQPNDHNSDCTPHKASKSYSLALAEKKFADSRGACDKGAAGRQQREVGACSPGAPVLRPQE